MAHKGEVPLELKFELALKAFAHTAAYDTNIFGILPEFDPKTGKRGGVK